MLVKDCRKCRHYRNFVTRELRGHDRHEVLHHYGWCRKHKKRCTDVRRCDFINVKAGQTIMDGVQAMKAG